MAVCCVEPLELKRHKCSMSSSMLSRPSERLKKKGLGGIFRNLFSTFTWDDCVKVGHEMA